MDDLSPREAPKTWGFRRSTIARREFIEEIGNLDLVTLAPRRNTRQMKGRGRGRARGRGRQPCETTSDVLRRARGGRRAAQANLEADPDLEPEPESDDLITAPHPHQGRLPPETTSDIETSDQAEGSDELTLKQLQERARKRQKSEEEDTKGCADELVKKDVDEPGGDLPPEETVSSLFDRLAARSAAISESGKSAEGVRLDGDEDLDEQNDADESSGSDEEYSDPNALYCICQQKHNNRQVPHSGNGFHSVLSFFFLYPRT